MTAKFTGRFTQAFLDNPADGTNTDGTGLYLAVRNGGRARSWSFRHRGKRRTIGSALRISLKEAQAQVRQFRDQLDRDEDPFATPDAEQEEKKKITFRAEVEDFYRHQCDTGAWNTHAAELGRSMIRNYINTAQCANWPLTKIGFKELARIFEQPTSADDPRPLWQGKPVIAYRTAQMLKNMFDRAIADDPSRYHGRNPALTHKDSPLRKRLGKQPQGGHRIGPPPHAIPRLIADLRTPLYNLKPDECFTAEAAEAIGCATEAILIARQRGKLPSSYKLPGREYQNAGWIHKIPELQIIFRFQRPPRQRAPIPLQASVLQFIIFTAVRSEMGCGLRWDEVREERGVIDFGKRHKMAMRDPKALYIIPLTEAVVELLERMRAEQQRNGSRSEHVFAHGPSRTSFNFLLDRRPSANDVNSYLKSALMRLSLVNGETDAYKIPSVHGFRNTFPEWACELNDYSRDHVDAQLGHKQPGLNWMYFRNVSYLNQRRDIMHNWEKFCLSLTVQPSNVVPLPRLA
jgi:integrase